MDVISCENLYAFRMLDYARQRMIKVLKSLDKVILITYGPAGIQTGEYPCEADGAVLYLLLPGTSDHLENLVHDPSVVLIRENWELRGNGEILSQGIGPSHLGLLLNQELKWCKLLQILPDYLQIRTADGWGSVETIEFDAEDE